MKNNRGKIMRWYKKIKAINYLGGYCTSCNNSNIKHLAFHHINKDGKEKDINKLLDRSWDDIQMEIDKCRLLCHNCHAEYHFNQESKYLQCRISKKTFIEYKGGKCKKCGYNKCQAALSFHHLDKSTKLFKISITTKIFKSILDINEEFTKELDKCELLCVNCHNEEEINYNGSEETIKYVNHNYDNIEIRKISKKVDRKIVENMYFNKNMRQIDIAKELHVSKGTICGIIKTLKEVC